MLRLDPSGPGRLRDGPSGYGLGPLRTEPARRTSLYALLSAVAALLVDVHLY